MSRPKIRRFSFPNGFVILFLIIILTWIATYIIPAGEYTSTVVNGKTVIQPDSFHYVKSTNLGLFDAFVAIPKGITDAAMLVVMIFMIGGAIRIFDGSGAIRAAIYKVSDTIGRERSGWLLAALMLFFGFLGGFPAMLESAIPFVPITMGVALSLGYDRVVGMSILFLPLIAGWSAGPSNTFSVGIGQTLAGLPLFSGIGYRMLIFVIFMAVTIFFVLRYAKKVRLDPTASIVYGSDSYQEQEIENESIPFTNRHVYILLTFIGIIAVVLYGTFNWKWGLLEMSVSYLVGGIIAGLLAGYKANKISDELLEGGKSIFVAAMAIGLARAIPIILEQGKIKDTVIHGISIALHGLPETLTAICMFFAQTVINLFIPSTSGHAMATLPIMLPLADIVGLSRQIAILAFQLGDGLTHMWFPTAGALIALLAFSKISYSKWFKFSSPYLAMMWGISILLIIGAVFIDYK
ncbi:YfcC family protein [Peribacillus butanolivorans]